MYLKKIEINGFKSFADKTVLEFGKGITAIVGPNGSGKSNISDSIRWVLGEQSVRTLRGGKMEDIIFAGTQNRKQLGCAQVSLTIDNSDNMLPIEYTELTVSRRLYRSGESEYKINNTPCRLKDIVELFMDTGIGKDGYSLIGQGKIDEILSSRPEDRRNIFEEAAGIIKYKSRKEESQRKLERTKINLDRIQDIITELEEQIVPLEEQSKIARKYLELRQELKELEINLFLHNYETTRKKLNKIENDIKDLNQNKQIYEEKKGKVESQINKLKVQLSIIDNKITELNDGLLSKEKMYESKCGNLKLYNEKIESYNREKNRLLHDKHNEIEKIETYKFQNMSLVESKQKTEKELKLHKETIEKLNNALNEINLEYSNSMNEIEDTKSEIIQILKDVSELNNKINLVNSNIENLSERKKQILKDNEVKSEKKSILEKESNILNESFEALIAEISELNKSKDNFIEKVIIEQKSNEELTKKRSVIFDKLKSEEAKLKALNSMESDMEGFSRAVRSIVSRYKGREGIYGTVSDLIDVPKGYETAIEIALSASIQNIVVDSEHTAQNMIEYLKIHNLGRATFLPLTTIKPRESNINLNKDIKGFLGIASDIIEYDNKYRNIIRYLMGRIIICSDLSSARIIAKKTGYNYKTVTLDGQVINAGGSFTGGSTNLKNSGIISRKNIIKELKDSIRLSQEKLSKIESTINSNILKIKGIKNNIEDINKVLQKKYIAKQTGENKLEILLKSIREINEEISDNLIEIEQIDIQTAKNLDYLKENNNNVELLNHKQNQEKAKLEQLQEKFSTIGTKISNISNDITDEKVVFAEKSKILESLDSKIFDLNNLTLEINKKIKSYDKEIESIDINIENMKHNIETINMEIKDMNVNIQDLKNQLMTSISEKKEIDSKINQISNELKANDEALNNLIESIYKLELSKSKLESYIEGQINNIWSEYEVTIGQAYKYKRNIDNISETEKNISNLKAYIKSLGNVNVNSIEEYKKILEKYNFLKSQKEDLINAQSSLINVINEITQKMRHQFKEKFKIIRENFNYTFKELFEGGYADLQIKGDDILTSGIDIIVQPPGKKLQNLSLLSGGERGLSAIALIFAILKMKPTPFCILDEIEAALDDANVNRFAKFLRIYSNKTQFIIITHRKGSMAVANVLYGVTMEEKGVSKSLSLKLKGAN